MKSVAKELALVRTLRVAGMAVAVLLCFGSVAWSQTGYGRQWDSVPVRDPVVTYVETAAHDIDYARRWAAYRMSTAEVQKAVADYTKRRGQKLYKELLEYGESPAEAMTIVGPLLSDEPAEMSVPTALALAKAATTRGKVSVTHQAEGMGREKKCFGTGFFITGDGHILTCEHVVRGASSFCIKSPSGAIPAKLVKTDRSIDIALLKVDGAFRALPVAPIPTVKLGDEVFTVGFPNPDLQGTEPKLTRGEISSMAGIRDNPQYFQISVPVQPGNSGGALVNESGDVVGIVTARLDDAATYESSGALPQNVNYALKGSLVHSFLEKVPELSGKLEAPHSARGRDKAALAAENAAVLIIAEMDSTPASPEASSDSGAERTPWIAGKEQYNRLASGTIYRNKNGSLYRKP